MIVTRQKLSEQIQLMYSQFIGKDKFDDNIDKRLIDSNLDQAIAKFIKIQTLENFKAGNIELPSVGLIEYTLSASGGKIVMPVFPISLPYDMGVWEVSLGGTNLIPISNVQRSVMKGTVTDFLEGQFGYYVVGGDINLVSSPMNGTYTIKLLTVDFGLFSDNQLLPLSPELQLDIINEVLGVISNGAFSQKELNYNADKNNR